MVQFSENHILACCLSQPIQELIWNSTKFWPIKCEGRLSRKYEEINQEPNMRFLVKWSRKVLPTFCVTACCFKASSSPSSWSIPPGGTPYFSIRGIRVNIWRLRFYKKLIFGVCILQLKKFSIWGLRITAYEKFDIWDLRIETKLQKKTKF